MKRQTRLLLAAGFLFTAKAAFAQLHTLTYTERVQPVDSIVFVNNGAHRIVRAPVTEIGTGTRYAVFYAWSTLINGPALSVAPGFSAIHDDSPLTSNITIDSFPAELTLFERTSYTMSNADANAFGLTMTSNVAVNLKIDIGDTILEFTTSISTPLSIFHTRSTSNAIPFAQWRKYEDNPALINALDKWIDFIRIKAL